MSLGDLNGIATTIIGLIVQAVALVLWITSQMNGLRDKLEVVDKDSTKRSEEMRSVAESARYESNSRMTARLGELDRQLDATRAGSVRREELGSLELRLTGSITELQRRLESTNEKLSDLPMLRKQSESNGALLEKILHHVVREREA